VIARRARKVDSNQAEIVAGLRALGMSVLIVNGEIDLVLGVNDRTRGRRNYLLEIKKDGKEYRLKPSQKRLRTEWKGQYAIVSTLEEVLAVIGWEGDGGQELGGLADA